MRKTILTLALLLGAAPVAVAQNGTADATLMQEFIANASEPCRTQPAQVCVDIGFRFAAEDPDRGLTLADTKLLRQRMGAWFAANQETMRPEARTAYGLGILYADGMTMERLHAAFDADGDGYVTQQELLADVTLDQRPLGEVLGDRNAVDRTGLANRLGLPPAMVEGLFPR